SEATVAVGGDDQGRSRPGRPRTRVPAGRGGGDLGAHRRAAFWRVARGSGVRSRRRLGASAAEGFHSRRAAALRSPRRGSEWGAVDRTCTLGRPIARAGLRGAGYGLGGVGRDTFGCV